MTEKEALEKAIEVAGSRARLAAMICEHQRKKNKKCHLTSSHIKYWLDAGEITGAGSKLIIPIEELTGVPRYELSPDHYPPSEYILISQACQGLQETVRSLQMIDENDDKRRVSVG